MGDELFYVVLGNDLRFYRGTAHGRNVFTDRLSRAKKYQTAFMAARGADHIDGTVYAVMNGQASFRLGRAAGIDFEFIN